MLLPDRMQAARSSHASRSVIPSADRPPTPEQKRQHDHRTPSYPRLTADRHAVASRSASAPVFGFRLQPGRQPVRKRIRLARPVRYLELRFHTAQEKMLANGIPGQVGPAANRIDKRSRECQRQITLKNALSITPLPITIIRPPAKLDLDPASGASPIPDSSAGGLS